MTSHSLQDQYIFYTPRDKNFLHLRFPCEFVYTSIYKTLIAVTMLFISMLIIKAKGC